MHIPEQIEVVSIDDLVEEISQRKGRHPKAREVLVVGRGDRARDVFDRIAAGVVVERRTASSGNWRIDTNEGVTIRHASSQPGSLRGREADLVVVLNGDHLDYDVFADAALVVYGSRHGGRVVVI